MEIITTSSDEKSKSKSKLKSQGKRKWSSKKPKSAVNVETETSDEAVSPKKRGPLPPLALSKQVGCRVNKWGEDLCAVIDYRNCRNIHPRELEGINTNDKSDYVNQMCHDQSLGLNIHNAAEMKKRYKHSDVKSDKVKLECLRELMHAPMCKEKDAKVRFVVECFVYPKTKQRIIKGDEDRYNSQGTSGSSVHWASASTSSGRRKRCASTW